jgi:beta-N-acetylhexosaminidase
VTEEIVRGAISFDGFLMSDDIGMKALSGSMAERAAAVIAAGSDAALLCSGNLADTESVAAAVPPLEGVALARYRRATAHVAQPQPFDLAEAEACCAEVLRAHA